MFFLVDAFSSVPFRGNPAGVCFLDDYPEFDETSFQRIANYFNWSEISFLRRMSPNVYRLRWFTPLDEAPLCGHATLGAAHALFSLRKTTSNRITFLYKNGILFADNNDDGSITLSFPLKPIKKCEKYPFSIKAITGISGEAEVYKDDLVYVIVFDKTEDVFDTIPNFNKIKEIDCRAITITAPGFDNFDFVTRYFAPKVGLYEDPVCGSTHCRLVHYWSQRLHKNKFEAFQASKRTGTLSLELCNNIVKITGNAVTVCEFTII